MATRHPVLSAFGLNIRKLREAKKLTQEALAEKADLDPTYISGIERGVRNPSLLSIARVATALGTSISLLSKGVGKVKRDHKSKTANIKEDAPVYHATISRKFRFIDLFCGIGGFRIAFERAGGECVFSCDWDKYSRITYQANFGEEPHGDIHSVPVDAIPIHEILCAGFPCQPFSLAGVSKKNSLGRKHGFDDEKQGNLFFSIADIIANRAPDAFVLENVKNLKSHDHGNTYKRIMDILQDKLGYFVPPPRIIDARSVVPQHRERIFIVGFKKPRSFEFPVFAKEGPKLGSILETDPPDKYTLTDHLWAYLQNYAKKHAAAGNGFGFGLVTGSDTTRTLSARYHKDGSEILISQGKGKNPRRLTPRECALLMGYPRDFKIPVSDTQAYRQFGNSVVVPVVERIAKAVLQALSRPVDYRSELVLTANDAPAKRVNAATLEPVKYAGAVKGQKRKKQK